ncbi:MAG: hypothetical protein BroJett018_32670 [Chloroflexota bacterium]|nr:DUF3006 domain-containing protein [Chloroflexota bacterium]GIK65473.1 MAG: hypothetical protein BroJett018_32670 [Chloroflexota bacterium]
MKAIGDRFEGEWVVLFIEGQPVNVRPELLPDGVGEGHHLEVTIENGEIVNVVADDAETQAAWRRIREKMARLRRGDHLK